MESPLYPDDLVAKRSHECHLGVVERTHGDVDTHEPHPARNELDRIKCDSDIRKTAFNKFLKDGVPPAGTVLVRWQHSPNLQLVLESKLKLLDRSLLIGDVVKKHVRDAMSGIVIKTFTHCTLRPTSNYKIWSSNRNAGSATLRGLIPATPAGQGIRCSAVDPAALIKNVPASELSYAESPTADDIIIHKDSVGKVVDVSCLIALKLADNCVVEINDDLAHHLDDAVDSFSVGDIAVTKKGALRSGRWIHGHYNPNTEPVGTVMQMRIVNVEVTWLQRRIGAKRQSNEDLVGLESDDLDSPEFHVYDRTRRPTGWIDASNQQTVSNSEIDIRLNLRVRFKDLAGACVKYDGSSGQGKVERIDRSDTMGYDLNVFDVANFHTDILVQWQDLSISQERSIDVVPDIGIDDEHDAWPGEIAHPIELVSIPSLPGVKEAQRTGVVQSVHAAERIAKVRWCPEACLHYSVAAEESSSDWRPLVTRAVGRAAGEEEEVSLYEVEAPGELNVRRGDIVLLTEAHSDGSDVSTSSRDVDWLGEIVDTRLDGTLTVRLGAANEVRDVHLQREEIVVAIRSDASEDADMWDGDVSEVDEDEYLEAMQNSDGELEWSYEDAGSEAENSHDNGSDDSAIPDVRYEDENGDPMDESEVENEEWESDDEDGDNDDIEMVDALEQTPLTSQSAAQPETTSTGNEDLPPLDRVAQHTNVRPEQYLILEDSVPFSHPFSFQPTAQNASRMKRIMKEHKILGAPENLPKGVYVRSFESRLDLLRILFIGPAETPYADAPFVVDLYLPTDFPAEPPQAFFHSWSVEGGLGGVGRVNPNLYEDGKICLSLLGTWSESQKSEGWNTKSTVLQVIVSLLGLVLVREPYYNEAGYEHLMGLESSKRASELYSERVYLKARTFAISALMKLEASTEVTRTASLHGVEGLEDVLTWLYITPNGPRLFEKIITEGTEVLDRSEHGDDGHNGSLIISKGACIQLRRVVKRLQELHPLPEIR